MAHIGTSGWSYKHWKEIFYPPDLKPAEWLHYYSRFFHVTEINTSFYHLPKSATVAGWVEKVPQRFKFCPKISRYLTHIKRLLDPEEPVQKFFDIFDPVKKHLGPVLIQLPPSLAFDPERVTPFFSLLHSRYRGYRFALEARHDSWLETSATQLLQQYHIAWVIAVAGKRWPSAEFVTAKHIYLRFHGPNGHYDTAYTKKTMEEYAEKIQAWEREQHNIWAFFNNDGHGYALKNGQTLQSLLSAR
ncbi:DUF72 domain-containing protein [Chitinophaga solisilvae]|uniref:DUF72 domain-containing protein n=1 Tax=Chitinophaga solisilvae TaxID=1233460 RepID=UPI00136D09B3|nr:DUF72 domain-containing protein [Chitinophaga solisilvae]